MSNHTLPESAEPRPDTPDKVRFWIPGTPVPQGSKTAFVVGRRAVVTDQNKAKLKPWRAIVAAHADRGVTFTGPVTVEASFFLPRPQRPRFARPAVKPDIDKLLRALLDGLTDGGLIDDDARVVNLHAEKYYIAAMGAGVNVTVSAA